MYSILYMWWVKRIKILKLLKYVCKYARKSDKKCTKNVGKCVPIYLFINRKIEFLNRNQHHFQQSYISQWYVFSSSEAFRMSVNICLYAENVRSASHDVLGANLNFASSPGVIFWTYLSSDGFWEYIVSRIAYNVSKPTGWSARSSFRTYSSST